MARASRLVGSVAEVWEAGLGASVEEVILAGSEEARLVDLGASRLQVDLVEGLEVSVAGLCYLALAVSRMALMCLGQVWLLCILIYTLGLARVAEFRWVRWVWLLRLDIRGWSRYLVIRAIPHLYLERLECQ